MKKFMILFFILSLGIITPVAQARPHGGYHGGGHRSSVWHGGDWIGLGVVTGAIIGIGALAASANKSDDYNYERELEMRERELQQRERELQAAEDDYYYNTQNSDTFRSTNYKTVDGRKAKVIYSDGKTQVLEMADGTRVTLNQ